MYFYIHKYFSIFSIITDLSNILYCGYTYKCVYICNLQNKFVFKGRVHINTYDHYNDKSKITSSLKFRKSTKKNLKPTTYPLGYDTN